jgi:hyperosmotically inducible protein
MTRGSARLFLAPALAVAAALAVGGCDRLRPAPAAEESTRALGLRVRLELLTELGVDGSRVEVHADGGLVRLGGEVRKRATAELAEQVARGVDGVSKVESSIRVVPAGDAPGAPDARDQATELVAEAERELADAALETRVRIALVDRLGSYGFRIGADAADGVVTLDVPAAVDRRREAVKIAREVEGVKRVVALGGE